MVVAIHVTHTVLLLVVERVVHVLPVPAIIPVRVWLRSGSPALVTNLADLAIGQDETVLKE